MNRVFAALALLLGVSLNWVEGLSLTKDENEAYLRSALSDPDASFHSWAVQHKRPYALQLTTLLNSKLPSVLTQLGVTTQAAASVPHYELISNIIDTVSGDDDTAKPGSDSRNGFLGPQILGHARQQMLGQVDMRLLRQYALKYSHKKSVWLENARYAAAYNEEHGESHWLGLNSLSDMSFEDYKKILGTKVPTQPTSGDVLISASNDNTALEGARIPGFMYSHVELSSLPRTMDWRNHSVVTPVKNQGMCGSCWAFTTTGAIEGANALYTKKLVSLSEQELVDCDRDVDMGCSGGMMNNAYEWIVSHGGLHTEQDWPYTAQESIMGCTLDQHQGGQLVTIDGFQEIPVGDEAALLKAAAHQPVAVAVEADSRAFQLYMGGVMSDPGCGDQLNHGVLVVGYGGLDAGGQLPAPGSVPVGPSGDGLPYWLIKNSWGEAWGVGGYIKIQMGYKNNMTGMQGLCGITLAASYPVKKHPNPKPQPKPEPKPDPEPSPTDPVKCDAMYACPPQSTCCCLDTQVSDPAIPFGSNRLFAPVRSAGGGGGDACGMWGCCPMADAICCEDRLHCCPSTLPVCDTETGRCLPRTGSYQGFSTPWVYFTSPAKKTTTTITTTTAGKTKVITTRRHMPTITAAA